MATFGPSPLTLFGYNLRDFPFFFGLSRFLLLNKLIYFIFVFYFSIGGTMEVKVLYSDKFAPEALTDINSLKEQMEVAHAGKPLFDALSQAEMANYNGAEPVPNPWHVACLQIHNINGVHSRLKATPTCLLKQSQSAYNTTCYGWCHGYSGYFLLRDTGKRSNENDLPIYREFFTGQKLCIRRYAGDAASFGSIVFEEAR